MKINGKEYPLWQQFVDKSEDFIGKTLQDFGYGSSMGTKITGIDLRANGQESAFFEILGEDFGCGFDVRYGGISNGEEGYLTFHGYGGHTFRVDMRDKSLCNESEK